MEYHMVGSEGNSCDSLNGCSVATSEKECGEWAGAALGKESAIEVSPALNESPRGCYLYRAQPTSEPRAFFNSGSHPNQACGEERTCVCKCSAAVDVAFYVDAGASKRGVHNIRQVLDYDQGIRTYNFTGEDVKTKLAKENGFDVVFFPGGGGGTEERTIGEEGRTRIRSFLSQGGGYVGICAGAYMALSMHLVPFKNIPKPRMPNGKGRGDGNITMALTSEGLATLDKKFGVVNSELEKELIFYGGGPVMVPTNDSQNGTLTNPKVLARFTSTVPLEIDFTKPGLCRSPYESPDKCSGIHDAAVVTSTYRRKGTVVAVGPHPETDDLDFPDRHGPPSKPNTARAKLIQSFAKYAALPQAKGK